MKHLILLITLLTFLTNTHAKSLKVLFVGNSYTYVCGMPEILKTIAQSNGHQLDYQQQTPGGRSFQQHWEDKKAVEKMHATEFDVVVLQNQSFEPVGDPANTMKYGKLLAAEADKSGARTVYYLTMAYKEPLNWMTKDSDEARRGAALFPEMLERLTQSYTRLVAETGGDIAPVGIAWDLAYKTNPDLKLHAADHSHPSATGAYLTALVFYQTLFLEAPEKTPGELTVQVRKKGQMKPLDISIDPPSLNVLRDAAQNACLSLKTNAHGCTQ